MNEALAVKINCAECGKCCVDPNLAPVLFPHEEHDYQKELRRAPNGGQLPTVAKKPDGKCVYYADGKCQIYDRRPLECRLYPVLPDLSGERATFSIDTKQCPKEKFEKATFSPRHLLMELSDIRVTPEWRAAYLSLKQ